MLIHIAARSTHADSKRLLSIEVAAPETQDKGRICCAQPACAVHTEAALPYSACPCACTS